MMRTGLCIAAGAFAVLAMWVGVDLFTSVEAAPPGKPVDVTALRDAVEAAAKKGENVDEILKALDAFEKKAPLADGRTVTPELQALRDAVDAAAKKGENVEGIAKELVAVETAAAGRSLAKTRPDPQAQPRPEPNQIGRQPRPPGGGPIGFPAFPPPIVPNLGGVRGPDAEAIKKLTELHNKVLELMLADPTDPNAQKLQAELLDLMQKAAGGGVGGLQMVPDFGGRAAGFPDFGRIPDRARFGIRLAQVPAVAAEQLGLEPNTGIAVTMVVAGSAAEKAGLKVHDIILEFAGKPVTDNTEDLVRRVNEVKAGEKIDLVLMRKGKKVEVKGVELPEQPGRVPPALPNRANPNRLPANLEPARPNVAPPIAPRALPLMP
jgi:hypothetical protein